MSDGRKIKPGDVILGLASNGLHTNGYSLARRILFEKMKLRPGSRLPGPPFERTRAVARSTTTVAEEVLGVDKNYRRLVAEVLAGMIKGLATLTACGLIATVRPAR